MMIQDRLRIQLENALAKCVRTQIKLDQAGPPQAGDLYTLPEGAPEGIEFALTLQHRDDPKLWYAIPYDQNPLIGTWDVAVSEITDVGPGSLRCGYGIWIHENNLKKPDRSGFIDIHYINNARKKLAVMIGENIPIAQCTEVDDDPDYQQWLKIVARTLTLLEGFNI